MKKLLFISVFMLCLAQLSSQVIINEVVSKTSMPVSDEVEQSYDWIELYNTSDIFLNLNDWYLGEKPLENLTAEELSSLNRFPEVSLGPNEYLVILAVGDNFFHSAEYVQVDFKLDRQGEELFLYNDGLELVHSLAYDCTPENRSFGRKSNEEYGLLYVPTPGSSNAVSPSFTLDENEVVLSKLPGLYSTSFNLTVSSLEEGEISYTTDGSIPKPNDQVYTHPLAVTETYSDNGIAFIPSSLVWQEPQVPVFKGHTYKFQTFDEGCPTSEIVAADYFIRPQIQQRYPLPIFSITFKEKDFFGDFGIMVPGITGQNYMLKGDEWERRAYLQHFDEFHVPTISQPLDIRIRGRGSRQNSQKGLRLYARDNEKKAEFNYSFFPERELDSYKRLALRSGHSDFTQSMIKDVLAAELVEDLDLDYMKSQTSIVFMNGSYWGIQNVRENLDKYYLESHYDVNPDSLTIIKFEVNGLMATEGTDEDFSNLLNYAADNDLSVDYHFDYVTSRIDVNNFIDYFATELYFANWDWPKNNHRVWRSNQESGKYRWMFYDCDACFYRFSLDQISQLKDTDEKVQLPLVLLKNLLANSAFKSLFHSRYVELISNEFSAPRFIDKIDSLEQLYEPLLLDHIQRWSQPASFVSWRESIEEMKIFALQRPNYAMAQLNQLFGSPIVVYPNPAANFIKIEVSIDDQFLVTIRDGSGKLVQSDDFEANQEISIAHLESGMYFVTVRIGDLQYTEKLIKVAF